MRIDPIVQVSGVANGWVTQSMRASRQTISSGMLCGGDVNQVEVEEKDRGYPTVNRVCQGGPQQSPEIQSTLVWSLCWGATGSAGRSTQRGEQRRFVRARGNKGEVGVTRDQYRVW